jgi:hypothetical protein
MYIKKQAQQPPDSEPGFRAGKCIKMHKLRNTITKWTPAIRRLLGIIKNASKQGGNHIYCTPHPNHQYYPMPRHPTLLQEATHYIKNNDVEITKT